MFKKAFTTMAHQSVKHLRGYNPFVEFKSDTNRIIDKHITMNNTIMSNIMTTMCVGFGALGSGMVMLYQKSETDKKELYQKSETDKKELNQKIDSVQKELNQKIDSVQKELNEKIEQNKIELNEKIEYNRKEVNQKIDHLDQKLDKVLSALETKQWWFY